MTNIISFQPTTFDEIAGQNKIKEAIKTYIAYCKKTDAIFPATLMLGGSGLGKTSFAQVIANETQKRLHIVNCPQISNPKEIYETIKRVKRGDIVFFEEMHGLKSRKVFDSLLVLIEEFYYIEKNNKRKVPEFTPIGATTDEGLIPGALKNRFKFRARFEDYTEEELIDVSYLVASRMGFKLNKEIAGCIARASRGTPREVSQNTEFLRMYMIANGLKKINIEKIHEILAVRGYNKDGLTRQDLKYLETLYEKTQSLSTIAVKINVDGKTVQEEIEPTLIKRGLVEIGTGGRSLTIDGSDYVEKELSLAL